MERNIGNLLKRLRKEANVSSVKLSEMIGKSPAYVSQIENGRNNNPDYEVVKQILLILGINEDNVEQTLQLYGVSSPNQKQVKNVEDKVIGTDFWLLNKETDLHIKNSQITKFIELLIEKDISRAEIIVNALFETINSEEKLNELISKIKN